MFDTSEKRREISKWFIGIFTCCILIYLGFRHISSVAGAISWLIDLAKPLLIGAILALIFNVPMSFFERNLRKKTKLRKGARPLAIVLALALVFGMFIGITVLVVPELIEAVKLIIQIAGGGLDQLAQMETNTALMGTPVGQYFAKLDIDWLGLKTQMEEWFKSQSGTFVNQAVGAAGSFAGSLVTFFIGLVFAIYILSGKEKLKQQVCRLIHVWLPEKFGETLIHVSSVCSKTFRLFIAGQATEAIILGTLCMIGMAILRIPYAPMVGALVGVTALIPVVGAFVGTIVGAIMILTVDPFKAVVFVIFLLILQQIEGNMIYPKVVGAKINLPAMWVLAAVTIGGNLGGPIGMLLGVPAASAAYALIKEATAKRENKLMVNN
jgi:predicted PurR-regulated permease PerM